jgi:hypothetical protein
MSIHGCLIGLGSGRELLLLSRGYNYTSDANGQLGKLKWQVT